MLQLALAAVPCLGLLLWMSWITLATGRIWLGLSRMVIQLLSIGYALKYIFAIQSGWILVAAMLTMTMVSAWIAAGSIPGKRTRVWRTALMAIGASGTVVTLWILFVVLRIDWHNLRTAIPLAGMIFSNSINSVSIAGERYALEINRVASNRQEAKRQSFAAAMIPTTNSLFAVGVVSIPGMMTGQILDGADTQVAARYQIMVMMMLLASSGLAAMIYLALVSRMTKSPVSEES